MEEFCFRESIVFKGIEIQALTTIHYLTQLLLKCPSTIFVITTEKLKAITLMVTLTYIKRHDSNKINCNKMNSRKN